MSAIANIGKDIRQPSSFVVNPAQIQTAAEKTKRATLIILSYLPSIYHVPAMNFFSELWTHKIPGEPFWTHLFQTQFGLKIAECLPSFYQEFAQNPAQRTWAQREERVISFESIVSPDAPLSCAIPLPICSKLPSLRIAGCAGSTLQIQDANTKKVLFQRKHRDNQGTDLGPIQYLAASSDGQLIATADREGNIFFWDLAKQSESRSLKLEDANPMAAELTTLEHITFAPDGTLLAAYATSSNGFLCRWDPETLQRKQKIKIPGYLIESFVLSQDGQRAFVQVSDTIPWDQKKKEGNVFQTFFHELNFSARTIHRIDPPGPPLGSIWKKGFTVTADDTFVAAVRQGDDPTQLWKFTRNPADSTLLKTLARGEEIVDILTGMNQLVYALTNRNQFLVYDLYTNQQIKMFIPKSSELLTYQLGTNRNSIFIATLETGRVNAFFFRTIKVPTRSESAASMSIPSIASNSKKRKTTDSIDSH